MQTPRWPLAVAAAALIALPAAASAQSSTTTPEQNPPAQQQPQSAQPPSTTPSSSATAPQETTAPQNQSGQVDEAAAKARLSDARETLSQLTAMPEAAKLHGEARTQVSQLISDFNAMITTQANWRSAYAKVDSDLTAILGADSGNQSVGTSGSTTGVAGATGTTGSTAGAEDANAANNASAQIDPAIRAKLVQFRSQLKAFESAAGGGGAAASPGVATSTTANPSQPGQPMPEAEPSNPGNPATNTPGASAPAPTPSAADTSAAPSASGNADAQRELQAISSILDRADNGALTKTQITELKQHVDSLRQILGGGR